MTDDLRPWETELASSSEFQDGIWTPSAETLRINYLIQHKLDEISGRPDSYNWLYRDPADNRYWELDYPHPELHGGGDFRLHVISEEEARLHYGL